MSKRTRGNQRQTRRRSGARPAVGRSTVASQPRPSPVADDRLQVADDPTADLVVARSEPVSRPVATSARTGHARVRAKPGSLLASRSATEYVYVSQDLRRIAIVAGVLFVVLIALWVVLVVLGISPLY